METLRRLITLVGQAKEKARTISLDLGSEGDPQAGDATAVFQELQKVQQQLLAADAPPRSLAYLAGRLLVMSGRCVGRLREVKKLVEEAAQLALTA